MSTGNAFITSTAATSRPAAALAASASGERGQRPAGPGQHHDDTCWVPDRSDPDDGDPGSLPDPLAGAAIVVAQPGLHPLLDTRPASPGRRRC